jgi:hypothetical protein
MDVATERKGSSPEPQVSVARRAAAPDPAERARALAGAIGNRAVAGIAQRRISRDAIVDGAWCFAEAGTHVSRFREDVWTLAYDDDIARYNENEGRTQGDWASALWDAWGYCYIAACHTRGNAESSTWFLGHAYDVAAVLGHELWASTLGLLDPRDMEQGDTTRQDTYNRAVGSSIATAHPTGDLYELCFDAMMQGRLDLTAAGVPRGRRLRRSAGGS